MTKYCPDGVNLHVWDDGCCIRCGAEFRVSVDKHQATLMREDDERIKTDLTRTAQRR